MAALAAVAAGIQQQRQGAHQPLLFVGACEHTAAAQIAPDAAEAAVAALAENGVDEYDEHEPDPYFTIVYGDAPPTATPMLVTALLARAAECAAEKVACPGEALRGTAGGLAHLVALLDVVGYAPCGTVDVFCGRGASGRRHNLVS